MAPSFCVVTACLVVSSSAAAAASSASLTISTGSVDHVNSPRLLGGHLDPGYAQAPWHWTRNIVFGQSFEAPAAYAVPAWSDASDPAAIGSASLDNSSIAWLNENARAPSLRINYTKGVGVLGWANRGMGAEGLWVQGGGSVYDGFVFVRAPAAAVQLYVAVRPRGGGSALAETTLLVAASEEWQRVNFSLTPSTTTTCEAITPGSDPSVDCGVVPPPVGNVCVRCGGEFVVGLAAPGLAWIGFVDFGPGAWGSVLTVSRRTLDTVKDMGVSAIRMGGSVGATIAWKQWRGAPWQRGAMQATWTPGVSIAPLSPFEFVDAATSPGVDILPILTMSCTLNSAADWADLVEYCYGDSSTPWGAVRAVNDSHPGPYNVTVFELGNEQENPDFVAQVVAMEARRKSVGAPALTYLYPANGGVDNVTAAALVAAGVDPVAIAPDCHATDGPSCELAAFGRLPGFNQSGITCEVNARRSDLWRAVFEGQDLTRWFNAPAAAVPRLLGRMTSFVTMRSGHFEHADYFQGISYALPNMTWLQPPGYVHQMISRTWASDALKVSLVSGSDSPTTLYGAAQLSSDRARLVVQLVNAANGTADVVPITLVLTGSGWEPSGNVGVWTLTEQVAPGIIPSETAGNWPGNPTYISPVLTNVSWPGGPGAGKNLTVTLPPFSVTVLEVFGGSADLLPVNDASATVTGSAATGSAVL